MWHAHVLISVLGHWSHADDRATQSQVYECSAQSRTSHRAHELKVWEVEQGLCVTDAHTPPRHPLVFIKLDALSN